ncbi:hypothetical protein ACFOYW_13885 [Gryllotalpicola reticulitermitis]|uniref:Uncharacterized protein n=1 Tax=Gryllotalpicola reticulitermitis TaxID=1184153 RepID=A0ABV8Q7W4_9MICO
MGRTAVAIIGLIVMIALIVGLDVVFLRHHFVVRLIVNVAIVAVFALFYFLVLHRR